MNSTALDAEFDVWQAAGCAVRVDYSRAVMEELRLAAYDGFNRMGHGGVEIGGVLFGVRDHDVVKILAYRPLACEYAFGPSFTLWHNDRRALDTLLASPDTDSNLSGMQPVGWYHSHTRSEIQLSEKDLQLFHQYFPEIWQIALVLRPYRFDPMRAGFFFREPDGSVHAASSRHEFIVRPVGGKPVAASPVGGNPVGGKPGMPLPGNGAPGDTAPAPANSGLLEPGPLEPGLMEPALPQPASRELGLQNSAPRPLPPAIFRDPRSRPESRPSPAAVSRDPRRAAFSYPRRSWALAVVAGVALAGVPFWIGNSRASAGLSLRALDVGGQLQIAWNRNSRVIRHSQSGALEIEDGSLKVHHELSQEYLLAGNITYLRTTGNVLVRLTVRGADQSQLTEISRFLGPTRAPAAPIATGAPIAAAPITPGATIAPGATIDASPPAWSANDRSAKKDGTDAGPSDREREPELQYVGLVELPSNRTPPDVRVNIERARRTPDVSAHARRQLVLPPAGVPRPADTFLPAPPMIAANTSAAMATLPQMPALLNTVDPGPTAGKIIWTGQLAKGGTIQILGNQASQGHLTGGLPGAPVRVQVLPSELTHEGLRIFTADPRSIGAPEAPGAQNGWNRTVYVLNPRKAGEIGILEAPGQQNAWNRLILRAEHGGHSIIVLRWERVPAESALPVGGNR